MSAILQDLRYAARTLRKNPGFAAIAILTLALGIGATTAIFSVVDALLLRPLPYPEPNRVVTVWQDQRREGNPRGEVAPGNFLDWRERATSFDVLAAIEPFSLALTGDGPPEDIHTGVVSARFFEILGLRPALGRTFLPEEHQPGAGRAVILSHGLWTRRFGADSSIVGRALILDGEPHIVVGVTSRELELGLEPRVEASGLWTPMVTQDWHRLERASAWWKVIGRLAPDATLEQAQAEMSRVAASIAEEHPTTNAGVGATVVTLPEHLVGSARPALLTLLAAVSVVLLIACANVAHLLLARGSEREPEIAVRVALGAGRRRLLAQLLTEGALLAALGGAAGVLFAFWGVDVLKGLSPEGLPRVDEIGVDFRILTFALGLTALTALAFALLPAVQLARTEPRESLGETRAATGGAARQRFRNGLIIGEVALALTLLVGAGLLVRSFVTILQIDPGFDRKNVLALQVFVWDYRATLDDRVRFFDETLARIEALPGVASAGVVSAAPFHEADIAVRRKMQVEGEAVPRPGEEPQAYVAFASPDYFRAVGIPLVAGRGFAETDRVGAPQVGLVNETMWRRHWPGENVLGTRVNLGEGHDVTDWVEIVGVVGDVRHGRLDEEPRPEIFIPVAQTGFGSMTYFVRTRGDPAVMMAAVQREIWALEPQLTFYNTATLDDLVSRTLATRRFGMALMLAFAAAALVMAAVGIYGLIRYSIQRRTRELGIRIALGADRAHILRLVVGQGMALAAAGVAIGLGLALAATGALSHWLFEIPPRDAPTFLTAAALLLAVAALACYAPARRASRVDPMEALRRE